MWYCERKSLGRWWPQVWADQPAIKGMDGQRRRLRRIKAIAAEHERMNLAELQEIYGKEEDPMPTEEIQEAKPEVYPDDIFPEIQQYDEETGFPLGFDRLDLINAFQIWFTCHGQWGDGSPRTVGKLAEAFKLPPEYVSRVIDEPESPFFFARPGDNAADRLLDEDGL